MLFLVGKLITINLLFFFTIQFADKNQRGDNIKTLIVFLTLKIKNPYDNPLWQMLKRDFNESYLSLNFQKLKPIYLRCYNYTSIIDRISLCYQE